MEWAEELRRVVADAPYTQADIAAEMGVAGSSLNRKLTGRNSTFRRDVDSAEASIRRLDQKMAAKFQARVDRATT